MTRTIRRSLFPASAAAALLACSGAPAPSTDPTPTYQAVCPAGVEVFVSAEAVANDYHEIALLPSSTDSAAPTSPAQLRRKAGELGANGVIIGELKQPRSGVRVIGTSLGSGDQRKLAPLAIYVPADSERVRRACGYPRPQIAQRAGSQRASGTGGEFADSADPYRPYVAPPALDEAALARNPDLKWAMATARRVGIAAGFFEGHPGILKIIVAEDYRSAPALEYTLTELWEAYREHRPYDEPGILELWDGDVKVAEFGQSGYRRVNP